MISNQHAIKGNGARHIVRGQRDSTDALDHCGTAPFFVSCIGLHDGVPQAPCVAAPDMLLCEPVSVTYRTGLGHVETEIKKNGEPRLTPENYRTRDQKPNNCQPESRVHLPNPPECRRLSHTPEITMGRQHSLAETLGCGRLMGGEIRLYTRHQSQRSYVPKLRPGATFHQAGMCPGQPVARCNGVLTDCCRDQSLVLAECFSDARSPVRIAAAWITS
jgi:hypothetical protein